jgi:hypothetical protein
MMATSMPSAQRLDTQSALLSTLKLLVERSL